jgi:predicted metal-dependent HD superfamily phosphohydrolase
MNKDRWEALMSALKFKASFDCYDALYAAYSEKHRFYHTVKHIEAMLRHYDTVKDLTERPAELELAIWFHDAIYKAFSKNNELHSADWAKEFSLSNSYDPDSAERVHSLIMATMHNVEVQDNDQKLIVDIDLTILGSSPEVYDEFERNVRKEYKMVPSFIYRKKRKELLKSFLNNVSIYSLDYFKDKYENVARHNINRAIEML